MKNPVRVCAGALALLLASPAFAQNYPSKSVRIIVPFAAGGPADIYARYLGQRLQEPTGQTFVIDNRPGAGSIIGTELVSKSPADGYTLLLMSNTHTTNESLTPQKPFVLMRDFVPVAAINYSDLVMVVHPSVQAKDVKEFIALAKKEPGKLNYASSGIATPYHMAGELFKSMSGTDIVHIPHKASGEMRSSVIGGHVQMAFDAVTTMTENVKAGQVRALGTTALKRSTVLPDVPTISEAGVKGYEATIWLGIMAPAGTPAAVVAKLNAELNKVIASPAIRERWLALGIEPVGGAPERFTEHVKNETANRLFALKYVCEKRLFFFYSTVIMCDKRNVFCPDQRHETV